MAARRRWRPFAFERRCVSCGPPAYDRHWVGGEIYFCSNPSLKHLSEERRLGWAANEKDLVQVTTGDSRAGQSLLCELAALFEQGLGDLVELRPTDGDIHLDRGPGAVVADVV